MNIIAPMFRNINQPNIGLSPATEEAAGRAMLALSRSRMRQAPARDVTVPKYPRPEYAGTRSKPPKSWLVMMSIYDGSRTLNDLKYRVQGSDETIRTTAIKLHLDGKIAIEIGPRKAFLLSLTRKGRAWLRAGGK